MQREKQFLFHIVSVSFDLCSQACLLRTIVCRSKTHHCHGSAYVSLPFCIFCPCMPCVKSALYILFLLCHFYEDSVLFSGMFSERRRVKTARWHPLFFSLIAYICLRQHYPLRNSFSLSPFPGAMIMLSAFFLLKPAISQPCSLFLFRILCVRHISVEQSFLGQTVIPCCII